METKHLKHFINRDVEILVAGAWVEGHMQPIVEGLITLIPFPDTASHYGPTALKADLVQAIREVKRGGRVMAEPTTVPTNVGTIRSSLDQTTPGQRFRNMP